MPTLRLRHRRKEGRDQDAMTRLTPDAGRMCQPPSAFSASYVLIRDNVWSVRPRESDVQKTSGIRPAQAVEPGLTPAMPCIMQAHHDARRLGLRLGGKAG